MKARRRRARPRRRSAPALDYLATDPRIRATKQGRDRLVLRRRLVAADRRSRTPTSTARSSTTASSRPIRPSSARSRRSVLGVFGTRDKGIPPAKVAEFEAALKQAGVSEPRSTATTRSTRSRTRRTRSTTSRRRRRLDATSSRSSTSCARRARTRPMATGLVLSCEHASWHAAARTIELGVAARRPRVAGRAGITARRDRRRSSARRSACRSTPARSRGCSWTSTAPPDHPDVDPARELRRPGPGQRAPVGG